jgi:hypothetical protein
MTKRYPFPGIVSEIGRKTSYITLLVENVEVRVPVPSEVIRHYDLSVGNSLDCHYPKRREIAVKDIRPHEKTTESEYRAMRKNIVALFTRAQTAGRPVR